MVIIGAAILIACFATGNVNDNGVLGGSLVLILVGMIAYIVINKRITD